MQKSALLCKIQHTFVKFCIHTPHVQIFDTCAYFLMLKSAFKSASASANIRIMKLTSQILGTREGFHRDPGSRQTSVIRNYKLSGFDLFFNSWKHDCFGASASLSQLLHCPASKILSDSVKSESVILNISSLLIVLMSRWKPSVEFSLVQ